MNNTVLGPTTVGLIYVNPAGSKGKIGDPIASGADIRNAFSRMGFNDLETVALVGGGHAFGKMHGACPTPPCGDGKGKNTFTSGFEGVWTTKPTTWSNEYFSNLFSKTWTNFTGPGGNLQWKPDSGPARIRFSPEKDWKENKGTQAAIAKLGKVKKAYPSISYADIIVLAGVTALEYRNKQLNIPFCGGRVDAKDAKNSASLKPRYYDPPEVEVMDDIQVKGLTMKEGAALIAKFDLRTSFFSRLATTSNSKLTREQIALKSSNFTDIVKEFSTNSTAMEIAFVSGWTKLMTADRFVNNTANACTGVDTPTK